LLLALASQMVGYMLYLREIGFRKACTGRQSHTAVEMIAHV